MSETKHTPTPWRVEEGTDLIWGKCSEEDMTTYGMGFPIVTGFSGMGSWTKGRPDMDEREANAAFIVKAVNSHQALVDAVTATRALVSEAAMTGFNYADGDWAERLFANQARLSDALRIAEPTTPRTDTTQEAGDE